MSSNQWTTQIHVFVYNFTLHMTCQFPPYAFLFVEIHEGVLPFTTQFEVLSLPYCAIQTSANGLFDIRLDVRYINRTCSIFCTIRTPHCAKYSTVL